MAARWSNLSLVHSLVMLTSAQWHHVVTVLLIIISTARTGVSGQYCKNKTVIHPLDNGSRRCCADIECDPGQYAVPCDGDPYSTKCAECPDGTFMDSSTWSSDGFKCEQWRLCYAQHGLIKVANGTKLQDVECRCDTVNRGFYTTGEYCRGPKPCPKGEELAPNGSCLWCKQGTFKQTDGIERCKYWTHCERLGLPVEIHGNRTVDNICGKVPDDDDATTYVPYPIGAEQLDRGSNGSMNWVPVAVAGAGVALVAVLALVFVVCKYRYWRRGGSHSVNAEDPAYTQPGGSNGSINTSEISGDSGRPASVIPTDDETEMAAVAKEAEVRETSPLLVANQPAAKEITQPKEIAPASELSNVSDIEMDHPPSSDEDLQTDSVPIERNTLQRACPMQHPDNSLPSNGSLPFSVNLTANPLPTGPSQPPSLVAVDGLRSIGEEHGASMPAPAIPGGLMPAPAMPGGLMPAPAMPGGPIPGAAMPGGPAYYDHNEDAHAPAGAGVAQTARVQMPEPQRPVRDHHQRSDAAPSVTNFMGPVHIHNYGNNANTQVGGQNSMVQPAAAQTDIVESGDEEIDAEIVSEDEEEAAL